MARTASHVYPPPHQAPGSWNQLEDSTLGPILSTDAQDIALCSLTEDDSELVMMPVLRHYPEDIGEIDDWRVYEDGAPYKCWKTTAIYLKIGEHPRLVRFLRPDPLKWMPVLANPGGPNLQEFIDANRLELYDQRNTQPSDKGTACARIRSSHLPLIYQWSLHLASALEFIHSHSLVSPAPLVSVIFGDLRVSSCWLDASGTSLSVLGFLFSTFRTRDSGPHIGDVGCSGRDFQPLSVRGEPTVQSDIFLWGCVAYELMTGYWPGEGQGLEWPETGMLVDRGEWPGLERVFLGDVVRKCWVGEIGSAVELVGAVRRAIMELGVEIGEDDVVDGLSVEGLRL